MAGGGDDESAQIEDAEKRKKFERQLADWLTQCKDIPKMLRALNEVWLSCQAFGPVIMYACLEILQDRKTRRIVFAKPNMQDDEMHAIQDAFRAKITKAARKQFNMDDVKKEVVEVVQGLSAEEEEKLKSELEAAQEEAAKYQKKVHQLFIFNRFLFKI